LSVQDDNDLEPDDFTRISFSSLNWELTTDFNSADYYYFNCTGTPPEKFFEFKYFSTIVFAFKAPITKTQHVQFDTIINDYNWGPTQHNSILAISTIFSNNNVGNASMDNLLPGTNSVQINSGYFNSSTVAYLQSSDNTRPINSSLYDGEESDADGELWVLFDQFNRATLVQQGSAVGLSALKFDWHSKWWIILVIVGVILLAGVGLYACVFLYKRRKARYEEMV